MANVIDPTPEQEQGWALWLSERPTIVREVLQKYDLKPWKLYRMKTSGHRCTLYSVDEPNDGSAPTIKVDVLGRFNLVAFDRRVFGVDPADLEECDLPSPDEPLGALLTGEEAEAAVDGVEPGLPRMQAIRAAAERAIDGLKPQGRPSS